MSDSVRPHRRQPTRLPRPWDSPGKKTGAGCHFLLQCMKVKRESEVTQSCPTLSDPMDCSLPGSSAHGIFQARVLEWGAIAFSDASRSLTERGTLRGVGAPVSLSVIHPESWPMKAADRVEKPSLDQLSAPPRLLYKPHVRTLPLNVAASLSGHWQHWEHWNLLLWAIWF